MEFDALKRTKLIQEDIRELEDWIMDRERETLLDDTSIFYHEQIRERLEQYQRLQTELTLKEFTVRTLIEQSSPELAQQIDTVISNWSNLQKRVDNKVVFYTDLYKLYEELKDLLYHENIWLDTLQNRIYTTGNTNVDLEDASEELDSLERFLKTHSTVSYEKIFEISDRLQIMKVSIPTINSQINQFRIRWDQLHEDVTKKIHALNSQISDYQQLRHQITAMFEWMNHTDAILNSRLKDAVYASDVPSEADKLTVEFNQYEAFLRTIEDKIHSLRIIGKHDAAKRLEQQFISLKVKISNSINKTSSQYVTVNCYECTNCTDPFQSTSSVSVLSSCNSCYKLAINIAYAPYSYVVRKCVPACIETFQTFGGGSVISTCCTSNLCNTSSMITFPLISRIMLFIFIILNVIQSFY
ncbi:unnamed protein product [Rotaria sp. Silwood1]|nr:unnamed protein product [Rotaria sp. Silwood1]